MVKYLDIAARFEDGEDVYRAPKPTAADVGGFPDADLPVAEHGRARMKDAVEAYEDARELARDLGDDETVSDMDGMIEKIRGTLK